MAAPASTNIDACVNSSTGTVRIVASTSLCVAGETGLTWALSGATGPQGPTGPAGAAGATGGIVKDANGHELGTLLSINGTSVTVYNTGGYVITINMDGTFNPFHR